VTSKGRGNGEAQERIGSLGGPACGRKETPKEGEAHEGRGPGSGLNRQAWVRTLAGSKALKRGSLTVGRFHTVGLG
jgi:hypothetical protein